MRTRQLDNWRIYIVVGKYIYILLSTIQPSTKGSEEYREGWRSQGDRDGTSLADTTMASAPAGEGNSTAEVPQMTREPVWSLLN